MAQVGIVGQLVALRSPFFNVLDAAARILIQRDIEALDQLGILILDKIGRVFGAVLAGFR